MSDDISIDPPVEVLQPEAEKRRFAAFETLGIPAFRFLLVDSAFNMVGFQARLMAQAWLVLSLTNSDFWVGMANGLPAIPVIFLSLIGGVWADRANRKVMLVWTRLFLAGLGLITAAMISLGVMEIWHLIALSFFVAVAQSFGITASQTIMMDIAGRDRIFSANALFGATFNFSMFVGPAIGGVMIARLGVDAAFYLVAGFMVIAGVAAWNIRNMQPPLPTAKTSAWEDMKNGLAYIFGSPLFRWLLLLSVTLVFAGFWNPLLPRYARDVLNSGVEGYGAILAAQGVGGIIGVISLIAAGNVRALGKILVVSALAFTVLMVAFAFSTSLLLSSAIAVGFGFIIVWWANSMRVAFQLSSSDEMRGRVMSVFAIITQVFALSWLLGGALSELIGPQATMISGMAICAIFYVLAYVKSPEIRNLGK